MPPATISTLSRTSLRFYYSTSQQTGHVPCLHTRQTTAGSHLPSIPVCRSPQLERSSPSSAPQHPHYSLEEQVPPLLRPIPHGHVGIRISIGYTAPHPPALHSGNHPYAHTVPGRRLTLHRKGTGALSHHWAQPPPSFPLATLKSHDDQAKERLHYLTGYFGFFHAPGPQRQFRHPQEFPGRRTNPATLANKIYGQACLLYEVDLSRAYRQLRTDPLDWPFLMLQWEDQYFVDISVSPSSSP